MRLFSKTQYQMGRQCPRALWLKSHRPELYTSPDSLRTDAGHEVGRLAKVYFGKTEEIEQTWDFEAMAARTREPMEDGSLDGICEATFLWRGLVCMVDILHRVPGGWEIVEVKSTSSTKPHHVFDVAFQHYVASKCGVRVAKDYLMHLDGAYVRGEELDIHGLFALDDVTFKVSEMVNSPECGVPPAIEGEIARFLELVEPGSDDPGTGIGCHCEKPHECGFKAHCWSWIPENSVFEISGMTTKRAFSLMDEGILTMKDFLGRPEALRKLQDRQAYQVMAAAKEGPKARVRKEKVKEWLDSLSYPLYFLDFETFQPPLPLYSQTRCYEQVPSQWSIHWVDSPGGELHHAEFLAKEGTDPRRPLAEALVAAIPPGARTMAYNMSFEKGVIKRLSETYPDLSGHLMAIYDSMVDLMVPFKNGDYYMAAQGGSYSIKYVLPAMFPPDECPELDYKRLEGIRNGSMAMEAYLGLAKRPAEEVPAIREQLLRYCELDTLAMVRIWQRLESECRS